MRKAWIGLALAGALAALGAGVAETGRGQAAAPVAKVADGTALATFAGGCFWCMEPPFEALAGVVDVVSGFSGGDEPEPSYDQVSSGRTGHREVVQVRYDPSRVSYAQLLDVFWRQIDPTDAAGQFVDRGRQYTTAVFYHDDEQRRLAEASKAEQERSGRFGKPIATEILAFRSFWPAEAYHQDYYKRNSIRYKYYRYRSGRDQYLEKIWGASGAERPPKKESPVSYRKPSEEDLRERLTPLQYEVTQHEGTEPPFRNEFWDEKRAGLYVDVVSGEPLFSSKDKFDSGTGWPSFTRPLEPANVVEHEDRKLWMTRTEVRSKHGDSHLGHVFDDGPKPTGQRYCINSAALRFVPVEDLEREGYGSYLPLFTER